MQNIEFLERSIPVAPLKIAALDNCARLGEMVDSYIIQFRKEGVLPMTNPAYDLKDFEQKSFLTPISCPRFGTGEAKGVFSESIRGCDLYVISDVTNYSMTYTVNGHLNHMSPDDHFQDTKRIIAAATGMARRTNVIMPFLYESRQHRRTQRESLDCAIALDELVEMGVSNIITFDAHDPRVQNAIPLHGFDSFNPPYQLLKALFKEVKDVRVDPDCLMVVAPDEGAMPRAVYFSNVIGVDMGMFYKRRDYSTIVDGKNPIVAHEFLGSDLAGKDVMIVDDMISSGESILDVAKQLKNRKARRIFIMSTFGLFTDGFDKFDDYYKQGYFDYLVCTNLTYLPLQLKEKPYFIKADLSKYLATIIDTLNHNIPIGSVLNPTDKIHALVKKYTAKQGR